MEVVPWSWRLWPWPISTTSTAVVPVCVRFVEASVAVNKTSLARWAPRDPPAQGDVGGVLSLGDVPGISGVSPPKVGAAASKISERAAVTYFTLLVPRDPSARGDGFDGNKQWGRTMNVLPLLCSTTKVVDAPGLSGGLWCAHFCAH